MKIDKIITMASPAVRLEFLVMERTLRATGCDLPLWVIPYKDEPFDLPPNASWLVDEELFATIARLRSARPCRKFLALTQSNAAFFDADIVHLRDLRSELDPLPGGVFAVADTEWNKARWTFSAATRREYQRKSSLWLLDNFNSGFFAFEEPILTQERILEFIADPQWGRSTREESVTAGEQAGINFLIHTSERPVLNLCLPPRRMESTMAVDYTESLEATLAEEYREDYQDLVSGPNGPFFLHFAGGMHFTKSRIAEIFGKALTERERGVWLEQRERRWALAETAGHWPLWIRGLSRLVGCLDSRFQIQWRPCEQHLKL
jgi:hypothetical protein